MRRETHTEFCTYNSGEKPYLARIHLAVSSPSPGSATTASPAHLPLAEQQCSTAWSFFPHLQEGNSRRCWFFPQGKGGNAALKRAHCLPCPYLNKKYKVLERSVKVCLFLQLDHRVKVLVVDVSVNSEETLENCLGHWHEILWEWYAWKEENRWLILQLPGHVCLFWKPLQPRTGEISFNSGPLSLHKSY